MYAAEHLHDASVHLFVDFFALALHSGAEGSSVFGEDHQWHVTYAYDWYAASEGTIEEHRCTSSKACSTSASSNFTARTMYTPAS